MPAIAITFATLLLFVTFLEPLVFKEQLKSRNVIMALRILVGIGITIPNFNLPFMFWVLVKPTVTDIAGGTVVVSVAIVGQAKDKKGVYIISKTKNEYFNIN